MKKITLARAAESYDWTGIFVDGEFVGECAADDLVGVIFALMEIETKDVAKKYGWDSDFPRQESDLELAE